MSTVLVVFILFVVIPILVGHIIFFGSRYDEPGSSSSRHVDAAKGHRRQRLHMHREKKPA